MIRQKVLRPVALGVMAAMLAVSPVFAETTPTVSQPIDAATMKPGSKTTEPGTGAPSGSVTDVTPPVLSEPVVPPDTTDLTAQVTDPEVSKYMGKTLAKIEIAGNQEIPTENIMAAVISKPGTTLTEEMVARDLQSIYSMGWFYDLRPSYSEAPEGVHLTYNVMENPKYSGLNVTGNTKITTEQIEKILNMTPGQMINIRDANTRLQEVEGEYKKAGYILARISDVRLNPEGIMNVTINEGIVEDFKVKGNVKTKDYVILREIRMKKGEPFNSNLARRSMQRIYNLGFFEDVNVKLNPGHDPNSVEMEISVVEMATGTFGIGAGYSDADGFIGMVTIGDKNFRGTGDSIMLRWEFGGEDNKNYDLTYTKPWLDKHETTGTLNIYDITNEYADYDRDGHEIARYDKKRIGQELTLSRAQGEFKRNYVTIKNRNDKYDGDVSGYSRQYYEDSFTTNYLENPNSKYYKYSKYWEHDYKKRRKENFGNTRSITVSHVFDTRDNIYDAHAGKRSSYTLEYAGFGGDFDFTKLSVDYRYYWPQGQNVIAMNLAAGYAWGDMPLSQRFAVGGSDTLRGYEDDQFKGNSMLRGTLEYRIPIIKKVQGVLFTDYGYAWDKRDEDKFDLGLMKLGYGIGVRINSPLGPIKLDYGIGEDDHRFHFSFGGQF